MGSAVKRRCDPYAQVLITTIIPVPACTGSFEDKKWACIGVRRAEVVGPTMPYLGQVRVEFLEQFPLGTVYTVYSLFKMLVAWDRGQTGSISTIGIGVGVWCFRRRHEKKRTTIFGGTTNKMASYRFGMWLKNSMAR